MARRLQMTSILEMIEMYALIRQKFLKAFIVPKSSLRNTLHRDPHPGECPRKPFPLPAMRDIFILRSHFIHADRISDYREK
jgi:hypothetical protein